MIYPSKKIAFSAPSIKVNIPLPSKPSCRNCVYFIDKKSTEFATIGVCKLFQYKMVSPKGNMEYHVDIELARTDSNLCGQDGEYYKGTHYVSSPHAYKRTALAVRKFDHVDQTSELKRTHVVSSPQDFKESTLTDIFN